MINTEGGSVPLALLEDQALEKAEETVEPESQGPVPEATKESLLHYILKMSKKMDGVEMVNNYRQCFDLLFDEYNSTVDAYFSRRRKDSL